MEIAYNCADASGIIQNVIMSIFMTPESMYLYRQSKYELDKADPRQRGDMRHRGAVEWCKHNLA